MLMLRRVSFFSSKADLERESFSIFQKLSGKPETPQIQALADEIMTLSLLELHELSQAVNDPEIIGKKSKLELPLFPFAENRSPFPHPKDLFAGIDAENRPGMHSK